MRDEDTELLELAGAIVEGAAVDWKVHADVDPGRGAIVEQLRLVAAIAELHRGQPESDRTDAPESWGSLELLERIGHGGCGEVWRSYDPALQREVALKLLHPGRAAQEIEARVLREGRSLARVRHPNVVSVYGVETCAGRTGLWMEFVHGRTLAELLGEHGRLSAREAVLIGLDLCRALAAVHAAGLVHCDIKAHNVLREDGGRIVLMDFGAGAALSPQGDAAPLPVSGTPLYMAPEMFEGCAATVQTDLYSAGVLLYHLVTGSYPVQGSSVGGLKEAHRRGEALLLRDARPDLPAAFVSAVERALEPDPAARYASAGLMERALAASVEPEGAAAAAAGPQPMRWRRLAAPAVLLCAGTLALLGLWRSYPKTAAAFTVEAALYRAAGAQGERLLPGARLRTADRLYLELEASQPVHVYVLDEDEQGEAYLLFPLPGSLLRNPLQQGVRHHLPGTLGGRERTWEVTSAGGREHLLIVASVERLAGFEEELAKLAVPKEGQPVLAARLPASAVHRLRGIGGIADKPADAARPGPSGRLAGLAASLLDRPETAQGVWVRQIDLENPEEPRR